MYTIFEGHTIDYLYPCYCNIDTKDGHSILGSRVRYYKKRLGKLMIDKKIRGCKDCYRDYV